MAAGNIDKKIASRLEKLGFELMYTKPVLSVLEGLYFHPDMQVAVIDGYAVCEPSVFDEYKDFIASAGLEALCGNTRLSSTYPNDIAYNISVVSDYVFHNTKYTDSRIINATASEFINVNQGYCGCSICNVGKDALITADMSIYKACLRVGIDALLISPGNIRLEGFDYGFIGGASFCYDNTVYFFGNIESHPDSAKIIDFCRKHGADICRLSDDILSDFGSLLILD